MPPKVKKYNAKLKSLLNTKNAVLEDTFEFESDSEEPTLDIVKGAKLVKAEDIPREDNLVQSTLVPVSDDLNDLAKALPHNLVPSAKAILNASTLEEATGTMVKQEDLQGKPDLRLGTDRNKVKASQKLDVLAQELADLKKLLSEKEKKAEERQKARQAQKALNAKARAEAKAREQKEFRQLFLINQGLAEKQAMQKAIAGVKQAMDTARSNSLVL